MGTFLGWYVILGIVVALAAVMQDDEARDSRVFSLYRMVLGLYVGVLLWPVLFWLMARHYWSKCETGEV